MDDVVVHMVRMSPWGTLNALGRVNRAASAALREVAPSRFSRSITSRCVDASILPNGIMHGIAGFRVKCCAEMICDRGRALSIRITEWRSPTIEIDLQRLLIITSQPSNYVGNAPVISVECASQVALSFKNGICKSARATPLFSANPNDVEDWIASNMRNFDAATQRALIDRKPEQLIGHASLYCLWEAGESIDRLCQLMTSSCPTPVLMRLQ